MKNKARLFGIYLPIYLLVFLTAVALRTVALFLEFDVSSSYFNDKALITSADVIVTVTAVFMVTYIFTARKNLKLIPSFTSAATYVPTGIVSVALIFTVISLFIKASDVRENLKLLSSLSLSSLQSQIASERILFILLLASAIFASLSIVHFTLTAFVEKHSDTKRAGFGLCTVVFLALYSSYLYFNQDLPLNAPNKIVDQMAYLFAALFFLYETRLSLGRERWREYISFGFIASLLCAYSSIPSSIYYLATGNVTSNSVYEIALTLALFIFITSRLLLTGELIEDKPSSTVSSLIKFAEARDAYINPKPEPAVIEITGEELTDAEDGDGNQIAMEYFETSSDGIPIYQENSAVYNGEEESSADENAKDGAYVPTNTEPEAVKQTEEQESKPE